MGEESTARIDDSIADWESGLPSAADLTPLSQTLIPIELASAFKITAETPRSMIEVNRASQTTLTSLRSTSNFAGADDHFMDDESDPPPADDNGGSDPKRIRDESAAENCEQQGKAGAKRPRLVWTPQLHKRFVDVVGHLGLKSAVPKTIMQLMNVEGLTRENVASHLQKYRLYVKRMQGLSNEGPSPSDHLFASTPLPGALNESSSGHGSVGGNRDGSSNNGGSGGGSGNNHNNSNHGGMQIMQMPMMGMASGGNDGGNAHYHHHHHHHHYQQQYSNMMQQQRDWSGNQYNSAYSHHVTHNNK